MTAILILFATAILAWGYKKFVDRASGEMLMTLGYVVLIPWVVIALGAIFALAVLT